MTTTYTQAAREWVRPLSEAAELTAEEIERIKATMPDIPYPVELQAKRRYAFVAQVKNGGRARLVFVSPELQHHSVLVERREQILYALEETRLTVDEALPLYEELAEIETKLQTL